MSCILSLHTPTLECAVTLLTLWMVSSKLCCGPPPPPAPPLAWKCLSLSVVWFCLQTTRDEARMVPRTKLQPRRDKTNIHIYKVYHINSTAKFSLCVQPKKSNFLLNKFPFSSSFIPLLCSGTFGIYRRCQGIYIYDPWLMCRWWGWVAQGWWWRLWVDFNLPKIMMD